MILATELQELSLHHKGKKHGGQWKISAPGHPLELLHACGCTQFGGHCRPRPRVGSLVWPEGPKLGSNEFEQNCGCIN